MLQRLPDILSILETGHELSQKATLIGFSAVLMWALLALFTAGSGAVPPFQLAAMTFAIGAMPGLIALLIDRKRLLSLRQPARVWLIGIGGLFGYHFLYYTALRNAPAAEAGLIAYLWPMLIVVGSALLPTEKLRWFHIAGAVLAFTGCALLLDQSAGGYSGQYGAGHMAALFCAFFWSGYSLLSRSLGSVPTDTVTGFCAASAFLSLLSHLVFENTVWPQALSEWLAVLGLGLFPVGFAFYAWDYGVKRGNIQLLGVASYAAPVLSTIFLVIFGFAEASLMLAIACVLVAGGAMVASKDVLFGGS